ncbi:MAG: TolC family outer membrane protein [Rhodomicrobium sp.]
MQFDRSSRCRFARKRRAWTLLAALFVPFVLTFPVHGETLKEALAAAYLYNPTLKAARAQLRATDNGVSIAKSGYRPTISATLQDGYENLHAKVPAGPMGTLPFCLGTAGGTVATCSSGPFSPLPLSSLSGSSLTQGTSNPRSAQVALTQNVFDGFRTYNNVKGSEALVEAGREDLRASEISVLLSATTAYANVFRDQAIVNLRRSNVRVLAEQLRATQDRFKVGEVTRTDVALAESGLASAQADLSIAQGTLYGDQALFAQYIGHPPGSLKDPGAPTRMMPKSLQGAIEIAQSENPGVISAIFHERAQEHQVKLLKGQLLPTLSLNAQYSVTSQPFGFSSIQQEEDARVYGQLTIPLYQAGSVSAQIRQAIETLSQARQNIDAQRELARYNVSAQWGLVIAAKGNIAAGKSAVESSRIALQGTREEEKVGQRTILDVLSAEQTFLNAGVNLISFQHDLVVSSYGVLAYEGRLTAYDIALEAELYDPTRYYGEVKDAWFGWGASVESREDPRVAPVDQPGRTPGQKSTDGPAYTQRLPQIP